MAVAKKAGLPKQAVEAPVAGVELGEAAVRYASVKAWPALLS